jgi:hypothetical protein
VYVFSIDKSCCSRHIAPDIAPDLLRHAPAVQVRADHAEGAGGGLGGATPHVELAETALITCTALLLNVNGLPIISQRLYCRSCLTDMSLISQRLSYRSYPSDYLVTATSLSLKFQRHSSRSCKLLAVSFLTMRWNQAGPHIVLPGHGSPRTRPVEAGKCHRAKCPDGHRAAGPPETAAVHPGVHGANTPGEGPGSVGVVPVRQTRLGFSIRKQ